MKKLLYLLVLQLTFGFAKSQCPQVFDYLGNPSSNPYWISCSGGPYTLNFQSPSSWGTYTLNWGDGSPTVISSNYVANTILTHVYNPTVDTFVVDVIIPSLCSITGVVVMELPVNSIVSIPPGGQTEGCSPATFSFSNISTDVSQTTHFEWDFGDGSPLVNMTYTNANQVVSHLYTSANVNCQTQVTLKAWNYCSFTNTSVAVLGPLNVFDKDVSSIVASDPIKCWPDNVFTFSSTSTQNCATQGNNYPRYQYWKLGNYWAINSFQDSIIPWTPNPPAGPQTVAFPFNGFFTVMLVDSNICGVDTSLSSVNIFNAPTASIVAPTSTICQNAAVTFTNASSPGSIFKWDTGSGFVSLPPGPQTFTFSTPGTYTVKLIAYYPFHNSCSDTDEVIINVLPIPTASFTHAPVQACDVLSNVTFTDTSVGATAWFWDFGNSNFDFNQVPASQTYTAPGTHIITLLITGANGCQATTTGTVEVYPSPTPSFVADFVCEGSATSFTNMSSASFTLPITGFTWDFGDSSPTTAVSNPVHTYSAGGVYNVTLTATNGTCTNTFVQGVQVYFKPVPNFVMSQTVGCNPLGITFTNTSTGGISSVWNFGDSSPTTTVVSPTHTYVSPSTVNQTYTITLVVTNNSGCSDSIKKTAIKLGGPVVNMNMTQPNSCPPIQVSFTNTSTNYTTFAWNFGNGQTSTSMTATTTFTNGSTTTNTFYPITLVATSANGCKDSVVKNFFVFPKPIAKFGVDTPACANKVITFTNQTIGGTSYNWAFTNPTPVIDPNTDPTHVFTNTLLTPVSHTTQLVAINPNGCTDTVRVSFLIHPAPNVPITASRDSGCSVLRVNFSSSSSLSNLKWNLGNGNTPTLTLPATSYLNSGSIARIYSVTLTADDSKGCTGIGNKIIKVFPKPTALFNTSTLTLYLPDATPVLVNTSTGADKYNWFFGDGSTSTSTNPVYKYTAEGRYQIKLIAETNKGCKDTFELASKVEVLSLDQVEIPNAFTPNTAGSPGKVYDPKDLSNDIFHPNFIGVEKYKMSIFSRWGELMFETTNVKEGWDGYYKGVICPADVYVYKIYAKLVSGTEINKTGNVTLLR
jgi:gliding motility-associated-like protein